MSEYHTSPDYQVELRREIGSFVNTQGVEEILFRWNDSFLECCRRGLVCARQILKLAHTYQEIEQIEKRLLSKELAAPNVLQRLGDLRSSIAQGR